jgi:hypothetical protein
MSLVEIRIDSRTDPDGRELRELLSAIHRIEKLEAIHGLAVHALAGLGALLWVALMLPGRLPDGLVRFAILAFAAGALGLVVTLALERHWRQVEKRYLDGGSPARAPVPSAPVSDGISHPAQPSRMG